MTRKIIAYIVIVALVFSYMFFRERIYYSIHETDGFYIDIGHNPQDTVMDITSNDDELFIISTTSAKSGHQTYHAFTILSRDIKVNLEVNLDILFEQENLPEIKTLHDIVVIDDIYVLYKAIDESFVLVQMSQTGQVINNLQYDGLVQDSVLMYEEKLLLLTNDQGYFNKVLIHPETLVAEEELLYNVTNFSLQNALVFDDSLFMLFEDAGQYGLHQYDMVTKETSVGSVDPKINNMIVGEDGLYLLEYQGDYISNIHVTEGSTVISETLNISLFQFYDGLFIDGRLLLYGAASVDDQIHAVYGYYDDQVNEQILNVEYNNFFIHMIPFDDQVVAVMRTNYLMDYEIRKTLYTLDDILYIFDKEDE